MKTTFAPRHAWLGLGATWIAYLAFVGVTREASFGLAMQAADLWLWRGMRVLTVSSWLAVAAAILYARKLEPDWNSFLHAALATALLACLLAPSLSSAHARPSVVGSILFYALISGLVCLTFKRPPVAAFIGLLLFPGQLFLDTAVHILSGAFPLH